jgi:hypothetical protein
MKRSNNPNEWVQISLIDMQAKSDGEFRWIFIYHVGFYLCLIDFFAFLFLD